VAWNPVEITKLTVGYANIRGVHIAINDPGDLVVRNLSLSQLVGQKHQLGKGCVLKKENSFFSAKKVKV
jgi:hypothetical protein